MWIGTSIFNLVYVDACLSSMGFSGDCYFMISIVLRHLCKRELNILRELSHDSYDMYHVQLLLKLVIIHVTIGNNPIKHQHTNVIPCLFWDELEAARTGTGMARKFPRHSKTLICYGNLQLNQTSHPPSPFGTHSLTKNQFEMRVPK